MSANVELRSSIREKEYPGGRKEYRDFDQPYSRGEVKTGLIQDRRH